MHERLKNVFVVFIVLSEYDEKRVIVETTDEKEARETYDSLSKKRWGSPTEVFFVAYVPTKVERTIHARND